MVQMKFCSGVITCQAEAGAAALGVTSQGSSGVRVGSAPRAGSRLWPPSLGALPSELCPLTGLTLPVPPCRGRNAAGRDGRERLGGSVLEQIPFLQSCEDEDSDEDDELDSVQHKKQRVKLPSKTLVPEMEDEDEEDDSEDAINEFDFLGSGEDGEGSPDPRRCAAEGPHRELGEWTVFCPAFLGELSGGTHSCLQLLPALGSTPDSYTS